MSYRFGQIVFMQRRLSDFFMVVRKEGEPWEWNFLIITKDTGIGTEIWTEKSMLIQKGLNAGRYPRDENR
jgi:hypothetical protein